jgi:mRNA interferase RelE/StbE
MPPYRVHLAPAAERQLRRLRGAELLALRGVILALGEDPRPPGAGKLTDRGLWRIRLRIDRVSWRVVYQVRTRQRLVIVTRVARRDEASYRGL